MSLKIDARAAPNGRLNRHAFHHWPRRARVPTPVSLRIVSFIWNILAGAGAGAGAGLVFVMLPGSYLSGPILIVMAAGVAWLSLSALQRLNTRLRTDAHAAPEVRA